MARQVSRRKLLIVGAVVAVIVAAVVVAVVLIATGDDDQPEPARDEVTVDDFRDEAEQFLTSFDFEDSLNRLGTAGDVLGAECAMPESIEVGTSFRCEVTLSDEDGGGIADYIAVVTIDGERSIQVVSIEPQ